MGQILWAQESLICSMESGRPFIIQSNAGPNIKEGFSQRFTMLTFCNKMGHRENAIRFIKGDVVIVEEPPDATIGVDLTEEE